MRSWGDLHNPLFHNSLFTHSSVRKLNRVKNPRLNGLVSDNQSDLTNQIPIPAWPRLTYPILLVKFSITIWKLILFFFKVFKCNLKVESINVCWVFNYYLNVDSINVCWVFNDYLKFDWIIVFRFSLDSSKRNAASYQAIGTTPPSNRPSPGK